MVATKKMIDLQDKVEAEINKRAATVRASKPPVEKPSRPNPVLTGHHHQHKHKDGSSSSSSSSSGVHRASYIWCGVILLDSGEGGCRWGGVTLLDSGGCRGGGVTLLDSAGGGWGGRNFSVSNNPKIAEE